MKLVLNKASEKQKKKQSDRVFEQVISSVIDKMELKARPKKEFSDPGFIKAQLEKSRPLEEKNTEFKKEKVKKVKKILKRAVAKKVVEPQPRQLPSKQNPATGKSPASSIVLPKNEILAPQPAKAENRQAISPAQENAASETNAINAYINDVYARIERAKKYPISARRKGITGIVGLAFSINSQGQILSPKIKKGAHPLLRRAVEDLLKRTKLQPPPQCWNPESRLELKIKFSLY
ncbi:MAG: hypothetical protein Kow0029_11500 [Candidatus Rifleibacteriota bacterium]